MFKRGQEIETVWAFSMALIVIAVTVAVIANYNLLSPKQYIGTSCDISPRIKCTDYKINTTGHGSLKLENKFGEDILNVILKVGNCDEATATILRDQRSKYLNFQNCGIFPVNQRINKKIDLKYQVFGNSFIFDLSGNLLADVESGLTWIVEEIIIPVIEPILLKASECSYLASPLNINNWAFVLGDDTHTWKAADTFYIGAESKSILCFLPHDDARGYSVLIQCTGGPFSADSAILSSSVTGSYPTNTPVGIRPCCAQTIDPVNGVCLASPQQRFYPRDDNQVTNESIQQESPDISGDYIVWNDYRNGNFDIYMCEISKNGLSGGCLTNDAKTRVTLDPGDEMYPQVNGTIIVWEDRRNSQSDIYMCDIFKNGISATATNIGGCNPSDTKFQVTSTISIIENKPRLWVSGALGSNNIKLVWDYGSFGDRNVYMCDYTLNGISADATKFGGCRSTDAKSKVTPSITCTGGGPDFCVYKHPDISRNIIVFEQIFDAGTGDIYMCDLNKASATPGSCHTNDAKTRVVYSLSPDSHDPRIDGSYITLIKQGAVKRCSLAIPSGFGSCFPAGTDESIFVTDSTVTHAYPTVQGDNIAWEQSGTNGKTAIYRCRISYSGLSGGCSLSDSKLFITSSAPPEHQISPAISNDIDFVWQDYKYDNADIWRFRRTGNP